MMAHLTLYISSGLLWKHAQLPSLDTYRLDISGFFVELLVLD